MRALWLATVLAMTGLIFLGKLGLAVAMGLLVDAVCDIINIQDSDIQNPPDMGGSASGVVRGVVTIGESIVTLLALDGAIPDLQASVAAA